MVSGGFGGVIIDPIDEGQSSMPPRVWPAFPNEIYHHSLGQTNDVCCFILSLEDWLAVFCGVCKHFSFFPIFSMVA